MKESTKEALANYFGLRKVCYNDSYRESGCARALWQKPELREHLLQTREFGFDKACTSDALGDP